MSKNKYTRRYLWILLPGVLVIGCIVLGIEFSTSWQENDRGRAIDVVQRNKKSTESTIDEWSYHAYWGDLEIPVMDKEETLYKEKELTITLAELKENLGKEVYFRKGKRKMKIDLTAVLLYPPIGRSPIMYYLDSEFNHRLDSTSSLKVVEHYLELGAMISLRGFIDDTAINSITIRVKDEDGPYRPPVYLPHLKTKNVESFGFQLYAQKEIETLVRIDTTDEKMRHIFEMYKDMEVYEVKHIPGFRTIRRFVNDREKVWPAVNFKRKFLLNDTLEGPLEFENYPEYYDLKDKRIELKWGTLGTLMKEGEYKVKMKKITAEKRTFWHHNRESLFYLPSDNISVYSFKRNFRKDLKLQVGNQKYKLVRFDCWITPEDKMATRFISNNIRHEKLIEAFEKLESRTSIYFDNILMYDEEGEVVYFPSAFVFNIE